MATLEKIRSKSGLLLVIIGAALLAFIVGDFFSSGRTLFGNGTTIAKVGDHKIDVQEFQRKVQDATSQAQQQGRQIDNAVLQQQVLNSMIAEALFNQEIEDLGIVVTDQELTDMMVGKNSAYVDRMVQQQGLQNAVTLHDMAFNPTKYGIPQEQAVQMQQYWLNLEKNIEQQLLQQKFNNLFEGLITANDLDAKAIYAENASTAHVLYAKKDYSSMPDDKFEPSEADIKKLYDSEKKKYALDEETRLVNYIAVNIAPSSADVLAAQKKVEDALAALNAQPETQGLADMPEFVVDRKKVAQSDLLQKPQLKAALDSLSVGRATLVSHAGNEYTLAKLLGKTLESEKVKLDVIVVQGKKAQVDSLVAKLNGGAAFDSIAASPLVASSQKDLELSLLDANGPTVKEIIAGRAAGTYFTPDTVAEGGRIFRIVEAPAPVNVYDVASVSFTCEPSNATVNKLESDLRNYLASHTTSKQFTDSAQAAGYTTFPAYVTPSTPMVGNLNDSHNAVAWAMDAKKGKVSPVFGDIQTGRFLAVAVEDIYKDYTPVSDPRVNADLKRRAMNQKKGEKLMADYNGKAKDVAGYAALLKTSVDTTTVNFGQPFIPGLGMYESAIQGKVAAAKKGAVVGPVSGKNAFVVLQVTEIDTEGRPFNQLESAMRYQQTYGAGRLANQLPLVLLGNQKIKNNMNKFYTYK